MISGSNPPIVQPELMDGQEEGGHVQSGGDPAVVGALLGRLVQGSGQVFGCLNAALVDVKVFDEGQVAAVEGEGHDDQLRINFI